MVLLENSTIPSKKKDLIPRLFKLFHKIEANKTLTNSIYKAIFMLIPNPQKTQQRKRTSDQFNLKISLQNHSIKFSKNKSKHTSK